MDSLNFQKKYGFTLAEVLITLGIVGVVSALTLPVLIQSYKKHVVETRLQHFYSIMNQAGKQAELDYGEFQYWDNATFRDDPNGMENWWNTYFAPYIKTLKIEKTRNALWVFLVDGTAFYVFNYFGDTNTSSSSTHLYFYPKAPKTTVGVPGTMGKDYFTFFLGAKTNEKYAIVEPYKFGWDGKKSTLVDGSFGCRKQGEVKHTPHYCTTLIEANGWKIPKDYPFRF